MPDSPTVITKEQLPKLLIKIWVRFSKGDNPPALLIMIWPSIVRWRWVFLLVLLLLPVSAFIASLPPWFTKIAIDDYLIPAVNAKDLSPYWNGLLWVVGIAALAVLLDYILDAIYITMVQKIGQNLLAAVRGRVFAHTLRLPKSYFDTHPLGSLLTRITSDVEALAESLGTNSLQLIVELLKMTAFIIAMFLLAAKLTLVLLLVLPCLVLVMLFFRTRIHSVFYETRQALAVATGWLHECLSGVKVLQLFRVEKRALQSFDAKSKRFLLAQNRANFYDAALYSTMEGMTVVTVVLVLAFGASQVAVGAVSLGILVAFMDYIQRLFVPLKEFSQQLALLQRSLAALRHINQICETAVAPSEEYQLALSYSADSTPTTFQSLEFCKVSFSYQTGGKEVLQDINFTLKRGETLAIVGATGAGKSSIVKLLMQAYSGYQGDILINGKELRQFPADELNRLMAVVHQDVFLFKGSLAFNIGMSEDVALSRIEEAASYAQVSPFIKKLENKYQHQVKQEAVNFSAGQRQLFSLARAVAWQSELIVLDEATSAVDSITENAIQRAVQKLFEDRTVIAIAHRLSTIRNADSILVIDQGSVAESGTHLQLMKKAGIYANLVAQMQIQDKPQ